MRPELVSGHDLNDGAANVTPVKFRTWFSQSAAFSARLLGSPWAFAGAVGLVIVWALVGRHFKFSDTWQLVINTGTSIATFLIVFLIQNTQNRDARAMHLKLDEVIRAVQDADNRMMRIEALTDEELEVLMSNTDDLRSEYERRRRKTSAQRA